MHTTPVSEESTPRSLFLCGWLLATIGAKSCGAVVVLMGFALLLGQPSRVLAADPAAGKQWAVLIGVEKYHRASPLRYTINDVKQLSATLRSRGGFDDDSLLVMTDAAPNPRFQPLKASLQAELAVWLKKPGPADRLIVYFSGHGFRDADGKLYLAPIDCDPANPAATGIPIEWFREQIAGCRAGFKLLIIDACHAGSEKGDGDKSSVTSNDLGNPFEELDKVITLASSSAEEKSQIWEDRQQSLFSYWLNQGLKGHADRDGDGSVDIDELYNYVSRNVKQTSESRFPRPQNPRRIVRAAVDGVPVVIAVRPQRLKEILADIADQLALSLEDQRLGKVGVLEFINDTPLGEMLGAEFGLLGKYCSDELERRLMDAGAGKFSVVDRKRLQASLKTQGFKLDDLSSTTALKRLSSQSGGMPVIAQGILRNRVGRVITLQCKLVRTDSDDLAGSAGGMAQLNESEWAMLGRSAVVRPDDRRPPLPVTTAGQNRPPGDSVADQVVAALDYRANGANPLQDQNFPFRIWFNVGTQTTADGRLVGQRRDPVFRGNDCLLPVRKGEIFEIHVENRSEADQLTLLRLLVDGLNTLPEKETDTKGIVTYHWGQHVNLDSARNWILDPRESKVFAVRGFTTKVGASGEMRRFTITDADQSLAARRKFTEQLGLITAAFYAPAGGSRAPLGVGAGAQIQQDLTVQKAPNPGNLLGVVHIRYVDADGVR